MILSPMTAFLKKKFIYYKHITLKVGDTLIYQTISTTFTVRLIQLFINSYY